MGFRRGVKRERLPVSVDGLEVMALHLRPVALLEGAQGQLPLSLPQARVLYPQVRIWLSDTNKFVRAWSYNALHLLAKVEPKFAAEVAEILRMGLEDEPPSVKARIRQCLK